jgi:hypothetical protein
MRDKRTLMPLEGCLHGRRDWRRLIQGRKECSMVNPLEFCVLVGTDHRAGRLIGRLHREGGVIQPSQSGSPLALIGRKQPSVTRNNQSNVRLNSVQGPASAVGCQPAG